MIVKDVLSVARQANHLIFFLVGAHANAACIVRLEYKVFYLFFDTVEEGAAIYLIPLALLLRQSSIATPSHAVVQGAGREYSKDEVHEEPGEVGAPE